jgi:hypothetical protein
LYTTTDILESQPSIEVVYDHGYIGGSA